MGAKNPDRLTRHFTLLELGNPPVGLYENARILAFQLQRARSVLGRPLVVVSGYRDPVHNARVGGGRKSQHLLAKAADLIVPDEDGRAVYTFPDGKKVKCWTGARLAGFFEALMSTDHIVNGGLGIYSNRIHYDIRDEPSARWDQRR